MERGPLLSCRCCSYDMSFFFFQAEDGIRDYKVTGVQTCALPIFFLCEAPWFTPGVNPGTPGETMGAAWFRRREIGGLNLHRSEERRVGKECRSRWSPYH